MNKACKTSALAFLYMSVTLHCFLTYIVRPVINANSAFLWESKYWLLPAQNSLAVRAEYNTSGGNVLLGGDLLRFVHDSHTHTFQIHFFPLSVGSFFLMFDYLNYKRGASYWRGGYEGTRVECMVHLNREWRTGVLSSMKGLGTLNAVVGWGERRSETDDKIEWFGLADRHHHRHHWLEESSRIVRPFWFSVTRGCEVTIVQFCRGVMLVCRGKGV